MKKNNLSFWLHIKVRPFSSCKTTSREITSTRISPFHPIMSWNPAVHQSSTQLPGYPDSSQPYSHLPSGDWIFLVLDTTQQLDTLHHLLTVDFKGCLFIT